LRESVCARAESREEQRERERETQEDSVLSMEPCMRLDVTQPEP